MLDALFKCALGPRAYVLDRHALLQGCDPLDGAQLAALLRCTTVDDARLVEMDVSFDQTGTDEISLGVINVRLG